MTARRCGNGGALRTTGMSGIAFSNAFTPREIEGFTLWLRSDTGITKDGSNNVAAWSDQSGNAVNVGFAQATGAKKPLWVSSFVNGLPSIRFNGTTSEMACNNAMSNIVKSDGTAGTLIFAVNIISIALDSGTLSANDTIFADGGADWGLTVRQSSHAATSYNWPGAYTYAPEVPIVVGTPCVLTWRMQSGTALKCAKNRLAETSVGTGAMRTLTNVMGLGNRGGITHANMDLLEVLGFNVSLTTANEARAQQYLMAKYAIPSG